MTLTLTDLFCGAGGSSFGAELVPGVQVRMAANHWDLAVETHNTNLPHADHDVADISQVDPRRYPTTDLLWASPECTNHSQARGVKRSADRTPDLFGNTLPDAAAERSRATMWDVPRFIEAMKLRGKPYKAFVVENVVDVRYWMFFDAWCLALRSAGYCLHFVYLNSMHAQGAGAPAPQSRDRWYCVGHLDKIKCPDLQRWTRPQAYCTNCEQTVRCAQAWKRTDRAPWGRYRQQYVWRCPDSGCAAVLEPPVLPAAVAIDWDLRGERIGDRRKPLADKTLRRIRAGLAKYGRPIHLEAAGNTFERGDYVRAWPVDEPFKTMHTSPSKGVAIPPFLLRHYTPRGSLEQMATSVREPSPTQTASFVPALVVPVEGRDGKQASSSDEPFRTQTARNETGIAISPFIAELRGGGSETRPITDPLATVTAAGNHHGLVEPSAFVMRNNGSRGEGGEHCTPVTEPVRTLTSAGHQSLVEWEPTDADIEDCFFRMLEPHEIKLAMAFDASYVLLGNKREQVRLAGNAVTPPAARDLISALQEVCA